MNDTYATYLQSEAWSNKREQKLILSYRKCAVCGTNKHLHIHHLTYERIFREEMDDLMVLCRVHHEAVEEMIKKGVIPRIGNPSDLAKTTMQFIAPWKRPKLRPYSNPPNHKKLSKKERAKLRKQERKEKKKALIPSPARRRMILLQDPEFVRLLSLDRYKFRDGLRAIVRQRGLAGRWIHSGCQIYDGVGKT